jgi:Protein of unknown function (DUF2877)
VHGGFASALEAFANGATTADASATWPAIDALVQATIAGDFDAASSTALRLIGLGPGLTPSGDDFLIGFCAALRATEHPLHSHLAETCGQLARGRTTRIAEVFYRYAARGAYSERVQRLIASLASCGADLADEFEWALAWGASSGADCVLGVLLGGEAARGGLVEEAA